MRLAGELSNTEGDNRPILKLPRPFSLPLLTFPRVEVDLMRRPTEIRPNEKEGMVGKVSTTIMHFPANIAISQPGLAVRKESWCLVSQTRGSGRSPLTLGEAAHFDEVHARRSRSCSTGGPADAAAWPLEKHVLGWRCVGDAIVNCPSCIVCHGMHATDVVASS